MSGATRRLAAALAAGLGIAHALACAGPATPGSHLRGGRALADAARGTAPAAQEPVSVDAGGTYLQPNLRAADGRVGYLHVRESDMPWVVSIAAPASPPKYGSSRKAREVAIEAMRMWEEAIRPRVPWFRLQFVEEDPFAAVQVEWKRRIAGPYGGFGGMRWREGAGGIAVGGAMTLSTTPSLGRRLTVDEVRRLVAHEFGHVLGLGHCLDCDSAMNYSWHTRDRVLVTETDVRTFVALVAQPLALGGE